MPVLGLRGSGSWGTDDRPKSYRDFISYLEPNGDTPITAFTAKLKKQQVSDPEYKWAEKGLPTLRLVVNGSQTSSDTTIEVNSSIAKAVRARDILWNERTDEKVMVSSDPTLTTEIVVARAACGTTAAAMNDLDGLVVLGQSLTEDASTPTAVSTDPTWKTNYLEVFRVPVNITDIAKSMKLRWGKPKPELKKEALKQISCRMELAFLLGSPSEDLSGSQPARTTGGFKHFVTTNVFDAGGAMSEAEWDDYMESIFAYGSKEKAYFCGAKQMKVVTQMAKAKGQINLEASMEGVYGFKMVRYLTPHGELKLYSHPLLSQNATLTSWGFAIDFDKISYRYADGLDLHYVTGRQENGRTVETDEWYAVCGLEIMHENAHGIIKNVTSYAP